MSNLLERKSVVRVKEFLNKYDNNINLIALDESARTAKDAGNALNTKVGSIVKSLLFKDTDNKFYLCLVSGDKYISLDKIEKIIKKKIVKANANEVKNQTGYSIGGVPPICHNIPPQEIFIDENLSHFKKIYAAAGHPFIVFSMSYEKLCNITNGKVLDIVL
tara:strand:- start:325 stop:810 length:486 start_codon:yes stop_codon:yes gene_type:complete